MPSVWFKHKDTKILPYEVPYDEGQDVEAIVAAHAGNGWSRFKPGAAKVAELAEALAPVPSPDPPVSAHPEEK